MKRFVMHSILSTVLSTVFFIAASSAAQACIGELQFQGIARNVEGCKFQVEFTSVRPNQVCPIIQEDIKEKITGFCDVKEGDQVSGVIVRHEDGSFSID